MHVYIYILFLLVPLISYGYGIGEQEEQDPNDPKYQKLAEELVRYHLNVTKQDMKKVTVSKVTTQRVAGVLTRIKFRVFLVNGKSSMCDSEVWDQPWKDSRTVTYKCDGLFSNKLLSSLGNFRIAGPRDPRNPKYLRLANRALDIFIQTRDSKLFNREDIKSVTVTSAKVKIDRQITNALVFVVNTLNNGQFECEGVVLESPWKTFDRPEVTNVNCDISKGDATNDVLMGQSGKNQQTGGQERQNPKDPKYKQLAKESFKRYLQSHTNVKISVKKLTVDTVTSQVVAGTMIRIDFHVDPIKGTRIPCKSEIWQKVDNQLDFNVMCQLNDEKIGGQNEEDPKDPKYKQLAEESFQKYRKTHIGPLFVVKEIKVTRVTTQVVAGVATKLDFRVITDSSDMYHCHSEVLEQSWIQIKNITVICDPLNKLSASVNSQLNDEKVGGQNEQDPEDPKYRQLAKESFQKYRKTHLGPLFVVKEIKVTRVTTQVVAGVRTKLDFNVITDSSYRYNCHSEVLEQPWRKIKDIKVICDPLNKLSASANRPKVNDDLDESIGGQTNDDPKDPKYKKLAEESFKRYLKSHTNVKINVKTVTVDKVTTQVVAGTMIRIDFHVNPIKGTTIPCKSEIWEKVDDKLDFTVMCQLNDEKVGGQKEQDPEDPKYQQLAEESFQKYRKSHIGPLFVVKEIKVTRVTTQVVAGVRTKLDFNVITDSSYRYNCHSEVLEQPWRKIKDIKVICDPLNKLSASANHPKVNDDLDERIGGQTNDDPKDPKYKKLAEESFKRYLKSHTNIKINVKTVTVDRVTTQVVAGTMIRIDFHVNPIKGTTIPCKSEIWEKVDDKLDFTVMCQVNDEKVGGQKEQDPEDPKYQQLAKESFQKYRKTHIGPLFVVKEIKVTRVTTQLVAGVRTKLDFNVITDSSYRYNCHSEVLEQPWRKVKDIKVICDPLNKLSASANSQLNAENVGGQNEQDPEDPKYKQLAKESFQKYRKTHIGPLFVVKEIKVTRVTTQVVAGVRTKLDFNVITDSSYRYHCHSEVLEQPWRKIKDIKVICDPLNKLSASAYRPKVNGDVDGHSVGGEKNQDPNNPKYQKLAEESFERYRRDHIGLLFTLKEFKVIKVTTQVVSGVLTRLDFKAIPTKGNVLQCHSEILDQSWLQSRDIKVNCFSPSKLTLSKFARKLKVKGGFNIIDEAITDYFEHFDTKQWRVENSVIRSSKKTRTDFGKDILTYFKVDVFASNSYGDYSYYNCSAVFATNKRNEDILIGVNCNKATSLAGRTDWMDPSDKMYLNLARKAIVQYIRTTNNKVGLRGKYDVVVTSATSSLAAGTWHAIHFVVQPLKVDVNGLKCYTRVWEDLKGKQTITEVNCEYNNSIKIG